MKAPCLRRPAFTSGVIGEIRDTSLVSLLPVRRDGFTRKAGLRRRLGSATMSAAGVMGRRETGCNEGFHV